MAAQASGSSRNRCAHQHPGPADHKRGGLPVPGLSVALEDGVELQVGRRAAYQRAGGHRSADRVSASAEERRQYEHQVPECGG